MYLMVTNFNTLVFFRQRRESLGNDRDGWKIEGWGWIMISGRILKLSGRIPDTEIIWPNPKKLNPHNCIALQHKKITLKYA